MERPTWPGLEASVQLRTEDCQQLGERLEADSPTPIESCDDCCPR